MSTFKRGKTYWYNFWWRDRHVQASTHQGSQRVARQMEAAHKTRLAKGEVGIEEKHPAPALEDFAKKFIEAVEVRSADKPATIDFYRSKLQRLLEFHPLASARLDAISEALIERYVQARRNKIIGQGDGERRLSPASVNRELATLRRLLNLAKEWKLIGIVPSIKMLQGERQRDFVLSHEQERNYLMLAPQPLKDVALLILDTGLRIGETVSLDWADVNLDPANGATYGYLRVREGKSKNAKRIVSLTARVSQMLAVRCSESKTKWVVAGEGDRPFVATSLDHQHIKVRRLLGLSKDFVIHSLRHTMLTRLGEAGVDAFTIMKIAGHSSITVSQRYVHPSPESLERAFERLELLNANAAMRREAKLEATTFATTSAVESTDETPLSVS